jgi:hypothetical protein
MTFGNISAEEHQTKFEQRALRRFERLNERIAVKPEKPRGDRGNDLGPFFDVDNPSPGFAKHLGVE